MLTVLEKLKFKKYLKAYLDNTLEFEKFAGFFDEMSNVDPTLLREWIDEVLANDEIGEDQKALLASVDFSALLDKIHSHIDEHSIPQPTHTRRKTAIRWVSAVAATLFLVAFAYIFLIFDQKEAPIISYENSHPYNISVLLPDSSEIILFPQSKISFDSDSYASSRDITHIKGKVLYKVKKSEAAFNVDYQSFVTQALGTVFIVDANEIDLARVKLLEGKISVNKTVNDDDHRVLLDVSGEILIDVSQEKIVRIDRKNENTVHVEAVHSYPKFTKPEMMGNVVWTSELIELNQLSGLEIVNLLQQIYDVTVLVEGHEILHNKFSGSIDRQESLETFLRNYCDLNGCLFHIENNIVTIQTHQRKEEAK